MRFENDLHRYIYYVGQIDYSYWRIQEIAKHNGKMESPLVAMIDKATGFDKAKVKERIKEVRHLARTIIKGKSALGYDTENDIKFLEALKSLKRGGEQTI